jgi:preprotein translocase subunit SecG
MLHTILNVIFVLIAIAIIALILLQRGAGAQAGSGFGAGASATVFGARGSANFLSSATKWLSVLFFGLCLFMAWQAAHEARPKEGAKPDLGVMDELPPPAAPAPAAPAGTTPAVVPAAPSTTAPRHGRSDHRSRRARDHRSRARSRDGHPETRNPRLRRRVARAADRLQLQGFTGLGRIV